MTSFRITGLTPERFAHLFGASDLGEGATQTYAKPGCFAARVQRA